MSGGARGEFAAIERIRRRLDGEALRRARDEVWIGDDAAVLGTTGGHLLLATDLTVAGVHADLGVMGLDDLGWRAVVAALSDLAAMGAAPGRAVVAVAGPPATDLDALYEGIARASEEYRCPVVGGDLSTAQQLVVSVAVTGQVEDGPPPVLRSGARPGHRLLVTGPLGASAAGLRHLRDGAMEHTPGGPAPDVAGDDPGARPDAPLIDALVAAHVRPVARLSAGAAARRAGASAMIDVSDGLVADLGHLADASGVGFALEDVPVAPGARLEEAIGGGEDYELVIATGDERRLTEAFAEASVAAPVPIGVCVDDTSCRTLRGAALSAGGYEHPWR